MACSRDSCGFSPCMRCPYQLLKRWRKFNKHLHKWLGIPPSFTSIGLYIRSGQLQLPLSSVVEEFKVAMCRLSLTYTYSQDQLTREAGVRTRSGRKWAISTAIDQAESSLRTKDIIGNPCIRRQSLETAHFQQWSKSTPRKKRTMIKKEVRNLEEEGRRAKSIKLTTQGAWTKWNLPKRTITWSELAAGALLDILSTLQCKVQVEVQLHRGGTGGAMIRPDVIMWSPDGKKIILVELTVLWEEGCEEAAERKKAKYSNFSKIARIRGGQHG
ncbi:hypothetical protein QQF64_009517 [Cirrhinus molitorella]|uniref:Uncharacterized protein n=1 Tax=Cirrhinus molitorella TaxID=172907 RepID=A0ABR3M2X1_9TELE